MKRELIDTWCELAIVGLVLAILAFGPLALGGVRTSEFLVLQGLTVIIMGLWLLRFWLNPHLHVLWPPVCWGVLAFTGYAVVRYWFADLEYVARQELVRVLVYSVVFLACINNLYHQGSIRLVVYALVLLGTGEGCFAVYQYFSHSPHIWSVLRPAGYLDRASGTYICPNHLAGLLELILPLGVAFTVASRARPLTRVFVGYGCVAMAAGLALSISRAGWIAAAVGLLVLLVLLARTLRQWVALAIFVAVLLGTGLWIYAHSYALQARFSDMRTALTHLKRDTRYGQAVAAFKMWEDHPWFGVGPAHYDVRFRGYRAESGMLQSRPGRVHNDYLNTMADWGAVGAILVALPFLVVAGNLMRNWGHLRKIRGDGAHGSGGVLPFLAGASAGLIAILLHSAVDFNMHIPANAMLAIVLLALLASHARFAAGRWWLTTNLPLRLGATFLLLAGMALLVFLGRIS